MASGNIWKLHYEIYLRWQKSYNNFKLLKLQIIFELNLIKIIFVKIK